MNWIKLSEGKYLNLDTVGIVYPRGDKAVVYLLGEPDGSLDVMGDELKELIARLDACCTASEAAISDLITGGGAE